MADDKKRPVVKKPKTPKVEVAKRPRGRPPKVNANDPASIMRKIEQENQRFGADCATRLALYYRVINSVALAGKETPLKDRVNAAKWCIEFAAQHYKDLSDSSDTGGFPEEKPEDTTPTKMSIVSND